MPFFDFYFIFKLIFCFLKIAKNGFTYPQVLTGELTWRAGPSCGCDAALRPCGKAVGGPCEAQVVHRAQRARTRWRRPRVSMWVHTNARVGRHVAGRSAYGGPTG